MRIGVFLLAAKFPGRSDEEVLTATVEAAAAAERAGFDDVWLAELSEHGVDVCCVPLGSVWTPALERMGVTFDPARDMRPGDAAGRRAAVQAMSASTRAFTRDRAGRG
jgi:hypothetical protein